MQPTPSKFKKFLLPAVIILVVIVAGLIVWKGKTTSNQQAALFNSSIVKTPQQVCKINIGPNGLPLPGVPSIKVISPNGGETFTAGQQVTVRWTSCFLPKNAHIAEINLNEINGLWGGGTGVVLNKDGDIPMPNTGQFTVTLPTAQQFSSIGAPYGKKFKIQILYAAPNNVITSDDSDNLFTIEPPQPSCASGDPLITLIDSPITGGILNRGGNMTVTWKWCNIHPQSEVLIYLKSMNSTQQYLLSTYNYSGVSAGSTTGNYNANIYGGSDGVVIPSSVPAGSYQVMVGGKLYPNWNPDFVQVTGAFTIQ